MYGVACGLSYVLTVPKKPVKALNFVLRCMHQVFLYRCLIAYILVVCRVLRMLSSQDRTFLEDSLCGGQSVAQGSRRNEDTFSTSFAFSLVFPFRFSILMTL